MQRTDRARKIETIVRRRTIQVGQATLARETQETESKISRLMNADLPLISNSLALLGLKVVPEEMKCYDRGQIEAIFMLARARMQRMESIEDLISDDPE